MAKSFEYIFELRSLQIAVEVSMSPFKFQANENADVQASAISKGYYVDRNYVYTGAEMD